jgi:phosphatidylinositol-3-phosphatase
MNGNMRRWMAGLALGCLLSGACAPPSNPRPADSRNPTDGPSELDPPPRGEHLFVIVFENKDYDEIIGGSAAPYINQLATEYGLATNYYGVSHPSLPNYLAMVGGSTFGITETCTDCFVQEPHLGDQVEAKGLSWRAYLESMPEPCYQEAETDLYAKKHNPFLYFEGLASDPARCAEHIVPLDQLQQDLAANQARNLSFIVPDLCHGMHDCDVATGDAWLQTFLPTILSSSDYQAGGVVFITFDEGGEDNHIPMIVVSPRVSPGAQSDSYYDHYSLLRTVEDLLGLPYLGQAGDPEREALETAFL